MIKTISAWQVERGDIVLDDRERRVLAVMDVPPANVIIGYSDGSRIGYRYDKQLTIERA